MDNRDQQIDELLSDFLDEIVTGADIAEVRDRLIAAHPDLQPEFERRLRFAESIFKMTAPRADDATKGLSQETPSSTTRFVPEEQVRKLDCPHCGNRLKLVDASIQEVTCGNCGSIVTFAGGENTTHAYRQVPTKIGRFTILSFLGAGGFGTAYLAHDPTLDRKVALKVPRAGEFATRNERERFIREAQNAAGLRHDNIVQVYEIGSDSDYPYIVSEYIDGMTLSERITGLPISHQEIARLMILVAEAVQHAHERGIIHRDIKPSNIFLNSAHKPYVADFGLARNLAAEHTMTMDGEILGTPAYMSPEQASGNLSQVTARSDVYSLGVVLYRLLCRENPFRASGRMLIHQVIHDDPIPPRRISDRIPLDLETITLKAMSKAPETRYESAKAFADDLRRWQNDQAILARPESSLSKIRRWCRKNPKVAGLTMAVASLLVLVTIMSAAWAIRDNILKQREEALRQLAESKAAESQRRLAAADVQSGLRQMELNVFGRSMLWFSTALKHAIDDTTINRIRSYMLWKNHPRLTLVKNAGSSVRKVEFSPTGDFLLVGTQAGDLIKMSTNNSTDLPLTMSHVGFLVDSKLSANQSRILSFSKDSLVAQLRNYRTGAKVAELKHDTAVYAIDFSADSRWAATADRAGKVKIWNADSGALAFEFTYAEERSVHILFVGNDRLLGYAPCFRATETCSLICWQLNEQGSEIAYELSANISGINVDVPSQKLMARTRTGKVTLYDLSTGQALEPSLDHSSTIQASYFLAERQEIVTVQFDGTLTSWSQAGERSRRVRHPVGIVDTAIDPQQRFLAVAGTDGLVNVYWLHLLQPIGTRLVADESVTSVAFHPDGRRLATGGNSGVVRAWDLAGLAPDVPLLQHSGPVNVARFSPTGEKVITASSDKTAALWNAASGAGIGQSIQHTGNVMDAGFDRSGQLAASAGLDGIVKFVQSSTGTTVGQRVDVGQGITKLQFNPVIDAQLLVGCTDGTVANINAINTEIVYKSTHTKSAIIDLEISPKGDQMITGSMDKSALIRELLQGKILSPPLSHEDSVMRCGYSRDGRIAWTCSTDRTLRRWTTISPYDVAKQTFTAWPTSTAYTSQGNYVTTTYEGEVALWQDAQPLWQTSYRAYRFRHCQVDKQDRFALVCGASAVDTGFAQGSGIAILLDCETGQPIAPPLQHFASIERAFFDPAGNRIVTASQDHSARIWAIGSDDRPTAEIHRHAMLLCGEDIGDSSQTTIVTPARLVDLFAEAMLDTPEMFSCQQTEIDLWNSYVDWVLERTQN